MKRLGVWLIVSILLALELVSVTGSKAATGFYRPKDGFVPDTRTAIAVAEAILVPLYGEKQLASERPFSAVLKNGVWMVTGHLPDGWTGGVAEVRISKETCEIISVSHGK